MFSHVIVSFIAVIAVCTNILKQGSVVNETLGFNKTTCINKG